MGQGHVERAPPESWSYGPIDRGNCEEEGS